MKRIFCRSAALLLALLTALTLLASCSEQGTTDETKPDVSSPTADTVTENAETEATVFAANVPDGTDYGGGNFNILVYDESNVVWHDADFTAEEMNGDVLNDAVFTRRIKVEDALNVSIVPCPEAAYCYTAMYNSVQSADGAYDCGFVGLQDSFTLAEKRMLYDLNTIEEFELDAPWWDQNCVKELSIAHRNYQITGDISILYRKSIRVLYYNKALAADYQLASPYDMVDEKTWTLDALTDLCSSVSDDLDGNGKRDKNDRYGIVYSSGTAPIAFVASGVDYATKDDDDLPVISFYSEKTVNVWDKYAALLFDEQIAANCTATGWDYSGMFLADQGLFCCMELHHVEELREMDHDFGILPMPLFDTAQNDYHVMVNVGPAAACLIPVTNTELTRTAYILDSLGAEGKNILTPAYYETYLKGKTTRDEESRRSLEIIFNSVRYDIGACYDWGGICNLPYNLLSSASTDLASAYKKIEKIANKALERTIKGFMNE